MHNYSDRYEHICGRVLRQLDHVAVFLKSINNSFSRIFILVI